MKVLCSSRRGSDLPAGYIDSAGGFDKDTVFSLEVGKEYLVYALTIRRGGVWYYLIDDRGLSYPVWHPAPLFEVSDHRLSRFWVFGFRDGGIRSGDVIFAFVEWAADPLGFYDRLSDGEAAASGVFARYRPLLELEFGIYAEDAAAEDIGDGWLMCVQCREVWRESVRGDFVRCPNCSAVLKNPEAEDQIRRHS